MCADSRFEKPRNFLRKRRFSCFSLVRKEPKVHQRFANLWTPGTIQSSAGRDFAKKNSFLAPAKISDKESIFQRTKTSTSHQTKTNAQLQILSAKTCCELAVQQFFFEKQQSCVCTTVTLSHRFKAFTPAFCRQNRFRYEPPKVSAKSFPTEL